MAGDGTRTRYFWLQPDGDGYGNLFLEGRPSLIESYGIRRYKYLDCDKLYKSVCNWGMRKVFGMRCKRLDKNKLYRIQLTVKRIYKKDERMKDESESTITSKDKVSDTKESTSIGSDRVVDEVHQTV
jgi:hypothetical protein